MDIRYMDLLSAQGYGSMKSTLNVKATDLEEYALGDNRMRSVIEALQNMQGCNTWDPVFQAWRPFMQTYLGSSCSPSLTARYFEWICSIPQEMAVQPHPLSAMYDEIQTLINGRRGTIFVSVSYDEVMKFVNEKCRFMLVQSKNILAKLHDRGLNQSTLKELVDSDQWDSVMCALYLYRHCQIFDMQWDRQVIQLLHEKVRTWRDMYLETFDKVTDFVFDRPVYSWYRPAVRQVMDKLWSECMILYNRVSPLSGNETLSLEVKDSHDLVDRVNKAPAWFDLRMDKRAVWDAICHTFYPVDVNAEDFLQTCFWALCIPKPNFDAMLKVLDQFYWSAVGGTLTRELYNHAVMEYDATKGASIHPDDYLGTLALEGFPPLE